MPCNTGAERSPNQRKEGTAPKPDATSPRTYTGKGDYTQFLQHKRLKPKAFRDLLIKMLLYNEKTKATR